MASLTGFADIQSALVAMDGPAYVSVGWSVIWNLTVAQLRLGRSVVIDAVARQAQIDHTRDLASENGADALVVLTTCADEALHRSRIEGRRRDIPGWHELDWDHVQRVRANFEPPAVDSVMDSVDSLAVLRKALLALLGPLDS